MPLLFVGGALGGGLGGLATAVNAGVARRQQMSAAAIALAMLSVSAFAYGTYFIVAGALLHTMGSPSGTPRTPAISEPTPIPITRSPIPPSSVPTTVVPTPGVIGPRGIELTWPAFVNATGLPANDVMGYLVYRSGPYKPFTASTPEVIATLGPHDTRYVDPAVPTLTGPSGGSYTYRVTVSTRSGATIPGPNLPVQFPSAGRTEIILRANAAAMLSSDRPKTVVAAGQSSQPPLRAGHHTGGAGVDRVIFGFGRLPTLLRHAAKVEAHLRLWDCALESSGDKVGSFRLYGLRRSFTSSKATWNNAAARKAWTDPGGDYGEPARKGILANADDPMMCDLDATALVHDWIGSPRSEHGLLLKAGNETPAPQNQMTFFGLGTEGNDNPGLDPTLVITYTSRK
ncbi:DNRLRE domain-containing protein [Actinoallomurus sp. NPDC050550]|uniref:DNRLRE domain-containing protein n=1 Tax=Actinoallomurus sp. NPDC050550 TaxID=3154937 RepID=UPI0033E4DD38